MISGPYLVVLFVGAIIVVLDGQLILRNSAGYLAEVYGAGMARRLAVLVAVFFHLAMLGVVALIASIDMGPSPTAQTMLIRIGVLLLLTALGHGIAMAILSRMRQERESTEIAEAQLAAERGERYLRSSRAVTEPPTSTPTEWDTEQDDRAPADYPADGSAPTGEIDAGEVRTGATHGHRPESPPRPGRPTRTHPGPVTPR